MSIKTISFLVVVLVIGVFAGGWIQKQMLLRPGSDGTGAPGGLYAENYLPFVMYNDGYNSTKGITTSGNLSVTGTSAFGSSGTAITEVITGTCDAKFNGTFSASSTKALVCKGITGIASGDSVFVQMDRKTGFASADIPFFVQGAQATSSDAFEFDVFNDTGRATTTFVLFEDVQYLIID